MSRPSIDEWYSTMARLVSARSTCSRRKVGAVIVDARNYILSTGYNGVPSGFTHCTETPCAGAFAGSGAELDRCQALHAEQNALARLERPFDAATMYCTTEPCVACTKLILATSITKVVFLETYPASGAELFALGGRDWINLTSPPQEV